MDSTCSTIYEVLDISTVWQDAISGVPDFLCGVTFLLRGERSCNRVLSYSVRLLESYGVRLTEIKMALAHRIIAVPCRTSSRFIFKHTSYIGLGKTSVLWALWLNLCWVIHCGLLRRFVLLAVDADLPEELTVSIFMIAEVTLIKMLTVTRVTLNQCYILSS